MRRSGFFRPFLLIGALAAALAPTRSLGGELVSGPMLGYRAHRETVIWLETRDAETVELTYQIEGRPETARRIVSQRPATTPAGVQPQKFVLPLLEMGAHYTYAIAIDGQRVTRPYAFAFSTMDQWEWRRPAPDFTFIFGTCTYLNDSPYDRPGTPYGKGTAIFGHMAATAADFMIWGGDNTYLREADYSSPSGIWYRYSRDRSTPDLQPLLARMHHYATWDDHDYGPNDSNRSFEFKDITLSAFKTYWANPSWGEPDNPGVYGKFTWGDAAFFMLDDRYHRDESTLNQDAMPEKSVWGARQFSWLKQALLHAQRQRQYEFKFIVTGGQVLQTADRTARTETHEHYRREREALFDFIRDNGITGVVFLTGDVHFTGLYRRQLGKTQWVYELTSSPLTSGAVDATGTPRASDPALVPGTLVFTQNYCQIFARGEKDERQLLIRCHDAANTLQWERVIALSELK
jgi:alkaline phosphatase D